MIQTILDDLRQHKDTLRKLVFSDRADKSFPYEKICVRPFSKKGETCFQLEQFKGPQVFHQNLSFDELCAWAQTTGAVQYRQLLLSAAGTDIQYTIRAGRVRRKERATANAAAAPKAHNREKQYLLREGENIPALVDLGVFTKDFKIVKAKYDKYKQINRFVELIDDAFRASGRKEITILDFGCGKSYLTFIVYYYFAVLRGIKATVLGFDLKADVVKNCNAVAARYGYDDLHFYVNDVTTDKLFDGKVDVLEFVDLAHSPKNLMLRCFLQQNKTPDLSAVRALLAQYGVKQTLVEAVCAVDSQ